MITLELRKLKLKSILQTIGSENDVHILLMFSFFYDISGSETGVLKFTNGFKKIMTSQEDIKMTSRGDNLFYSQKLHTQAYKLYR